MSLTKIKTVNPDARGFQELYNWNGQYVVVSTVDDVGGPGAIFGLITGQATSGEESMVFPADSQGNVTDYGDLEVQNGDDSRAILLARMAAVDNGDYVNSTAEEIKEPPQLTAGDPQLTEDQG